MLYLRGNIQFTIPLTGDIPIDAKPRDVLKNIPIELQPKIPAIIEGIRLLKRYSTKINAGLGNEESITTANWHICDHEGGSRSCTESEQEI